MERQWALRPRGVSSQQRPTYQRPRHWVSLRSVVSPCQQRPRGEAISSESAASAAYAGLKKAVNQGLIKSDETIVCMLTGNGLKDIASAMKVAGAGTVIEPTLEAVKALKF